MPDTAAAAAPGFAPDTLVVFVDADSVEYPVAIPRQGHTDREVQTVAFRWACRQVAEGVWRPRGELAFLRLGRLV